MKKYTKNKRNKKKNKKTKVKAKVKVKAKGFTARNFTRKATLLNSLPIKKDEIKQITAIDKIRDAATMIQNTNRNVGNERQKKRIINLLLEYEAEHEERPYSGLPFHIIAGHNRYNLRDLLVRASKLNYNINDKKNKDLIRILGRTYWGLNDQQHGTYNNRTIRIYNDVENAFLILIKKILNIDVNYDDYLENDELYDKLIEPLHL